MLACVLVTIVLLLVSLLSCDEEADVPLALAEANLAEILMLVGEGLLLLLLETLEARRTMVLWGLILSKDRLINSSILS